MASGQTDPQTRTAAGLTPLVRDVLGNSGFKLREVRLVSLSVGPGSFTGLRIGVTTAKTLAYALGCEVLGLNTLEIIAAQSQAEGGSLTVVVDAQRQQLFVQTFVRSEAQWTASGAAEIIDNEQFLRQLVAGQIVAGSGLKRIVSQVPPGITIVDESHWMPQAETVGRLAFAKFQRGQRGDLWQLTPQYFRPSAAEEKRAMQS